MGIVDRIGAQAAADGERVAHRYGNGTLTYSQLWSSSGALGARVAGALPDDGSPVVVYGHKESGMLVAFLGAVRAGHPYIPVDASWPSDRIASVVAESRTRLIVAVRPLPEGVEGQTPHETEEAAGAASGAGGVAGGVVLGGEAAGAASGVGDLAGVVVLDGTDLVASVPAGPVGVLRPVRPDEPFYVIYTSGSTGRPKGVQITAAALEHFVDWAVGLADESETARSSAAAPTRAEQNATSVPKRTATWLNQAPFSFDLSVMDLYCALATGATLHSVDAATVASPRALHDELARADVTTWVSTPSFADLCLADPAFGSALLPRLETFLFCGETLSPTTAAALHERFPASTVVNTYGPTESTVAVTSVVIELAHLDGTALPVGRAKPGTTILIRDGDTDLPAGESGEIVIAGDTVSVGYLHRPDLTAAAFTTVDLDGTPTPAYRTGDLGRLDPDGMLHFGGRLDGQIKLHGYRIELEDIENNLRRVDGVQQAAVVAVRAADGTITHLHGFVQLAAAPEGSPLAVATALKKQLRTFVPDYMVPKVLTVVDRIPMTGNGKADRRALLAGQ